MNVDDVRKLGLNEGEEIEVEGACGLTTGLVKTSDGVPPGGLGMDLTPSDLVPRMFLVAGVLPVRIRRKS